MDGLKEHGELIPTQDELFNKNFQTMFYMLTGKPDSKSKVYNKDVCIDLDSIDDLNDRITRKFKSHYDHKQSTISISIHIVFDDKRSLNFSGWDEYKKNKITNPSPIRNITIIWDSLLKLPEYNVPQRHKLTVKLSDGMRPQELLNLVFSGKIEEVEDISIDSPIVASVDFIDQQIGDELLNIVGEWVNTILINERKEEKFFNLLIKHKRKIAYFLNWLTTIIAVGCLFWILRSSILVYHDSLLSEIKVTVLANWLSIIFIGFIFCFFIYRISYYLSNNIFRILELHGDTHAFNITNGDKNEIDSIKQENAGSWKKICKSFMFTIFINIICGVISTLIINMFY